ncbi:MAG: hypothetical protein ACTSSG_06450 [Candidatus Heimdallarchaeaceae archaeon]
MSKLDDSEFCAFHYTNPSDGQCSLCGLPICNLDQLYGPNAERICQLCFNISQSKQKVKYMQFGMYAAVFGLIAIFFFVFRSLGINTIYAFFPVILMLVAPYLLRPLIMKFYFKDLSPKESVLPILKYFEASGNEQHYSMFLKFLEKLTDEEKEEIKEPLFKYLVPALAFNFSKMPSDWEEKLVEELNMTKEEFIEFLISKNRKVLIQTAVHAAQPNISQFLFYLSESADDTDLLKEYIQEITSEEILSLEDSELNTIYSKMLEDLYLYEEDFFAICDKLNLKKEKELISQLLSKYEPPPVPKNQIEAVMTAEQLREKRRREKEGPIEMKFVTEEDENKTEK